jgi:phosphoenolpyruvate synthase/pyruvate phosphate dikinase
MFPWEYSASLPLDAVEANDHMVHSNLGPHLHTVWLDQFEYDRALVGGKGASLSRLAALGVPVPRACALTSLAYADFAASIPLPHRATDVLVTELPLIREIIQSAPLPESVAGAIAAAYREFESLAGAPLSLAVRSSTPAEDSENFSFAGLHDTMLGVRSQSVLEASVRQCWASLWSERAFNYRQARDLDADATEIAVIIQQMVRTDVSFVLFTSDPVTGSGEHLVISASWGLGEAVVSGLINPDHIVVDRFGRVVDYRVGHKQHMVIADAAPSEGTRQVTVPRALQTMRVMSDDQASEIAAVGRLLSARLGFEADIEGGFADGKLYLFQARPITTLGVPTQMSPTAASLLTSLAAAWDSSYISTDELRRSST